MLKRVQGLFAVALMALVFAFVASPAHAVLDVSDVAVDTTPVFTVATVIFIALGSMWAIRKVIKTINKS